MTSLITGLVFCKKMRGRKDLLNFFDISIEMFKPLSTRIFCFQDVFDYYREENKEIPDSNKK